MIIPKINQIIEAIQVSADSWVIINTQRMTEIIGKTG
jgi:hypothetical protein